MFGENLALSQALVITIIAMSVVFLVLILLSIALDFIRMAFYREKKNEAIHEQKSNLNFSTKAERIGYVETESKNNEFLAAISAAVAVILEVPVSRIKIRNIKYVPQTWCCAGKIEKLENHKADVRKWKRQSAIQKVRLTKEKPPYKKAGNN